MSGVSPFYTLAGQLVNQAHRLIQWTGRVYCAAVLPPIVEETEAPDHSQAWAEFQADFAKRKAEARASHAKLRHIEAEQTAAVNAALARVR